MIYTIDLFTTILTNKDNISESELAGAVSQGCKNISLGRQDLTKSGLKH